MLGRKVAIKRLRATDDEAILQEAQALARFQHPNIVSAFALEHDEEGPFMVMERIHGYTLLETIEAAAFPMVSFIDFVEQALDGLIAAHEAGFLHRDIKPENLMLNWGLSDRFQVKFLDFGLAKFSRVPSKQTLSQNGTFLGSIHYIAPEQFEQQPLDSRSDLYAFGCVCYFALTQRHAFNGETNDEIMDAHLEHDVTPLATIRPDLAPAICDWVMRLLAVEPNLRPASARATLRLFRKAIAKDHEVPTQLPTPSPIARPVAVEPVPTRRRRPARSRPLPIPIAARTFESSPTTNWWSLSRVLGNMVGAATV